MERDLDGAVGGGGHRDTPRIHGPLSAATAVDGAVGHGEPHLGLEPRAGQFLGDEVIRDRVVDVQQAVGLAVETIGAFQGGVAGDVVLRNGHPRLRRDDIDAVDVEVLRVAGEGILIAADVLAGDEQVVEQRFDVVAVGPRLEIARRVAITDEDHVDAIGGGAVVDDGGEGGNDADFEGFESDTPADGASTTGASTLSGHELEKHG